MILESRPALVTLVLVALVLVTALALGAGAALRLGGRYVRHAGDDR